MPVTVPDTWGTSVHKAVRLPALEEFTFNGTRHIIIVISKSCSRGECDNCYGKKKKNRIGGLGGRAGGWVQN